MYLTIDQVWLTHNSDLNRFHHTVNWVDYVSDAGYHPNEIVMSKMLSLNFVRLAFFFLFVWIVILKITIKPAITPKPPILMEMFHSSAISYSIVAMRMVLEVSVVTTAPSLASGASVASCFSEILVNDKGRMSDTLLFFWNWLKG